MGQLLHSSYLCITLLTIKPVILPYICQIKKRDKILRAKLKSLISKRKTFKIMTEEKDETDKHNI